MGEEKFSHCFSCSQVICMCSNHDSLRGAHLHQLERFGVTFCIWLSEGQMKGPHTITGKTQLTFAFPSSCEEKSIWNGRFEDIMISSCNRVDPFASTTLPIINEKKILQVLISWRSHTKYFCLSLSSPGITSGQPLHCSLFSLVPSMQI